MQQLSLALISDDFHIRRSARARRLRVSITPVGKIEVVVPLNASTDAAKQFVEQQKSWIIDKSRQIADMRSTDLDALMPTFIQLPAISQRWQVVYQRGLSNSVSEKNCKNARSVLNVSFNSENDVADLLKGWLSKKARAVLIPWLKTVSQQTGLRYSAASIRGQRTRWASCSARKNISLNRCMLFLEPEQVQYLLIHELCHTREMNHSHRFWQLVGQFVPDYRENERQVNECCYRLPRWAY